MKVEIGGISMGGYGALHLAEVAPSTFRAVGARSPALWRTGGETAPHAFDDAEDFDRTDVIAGAGKLTMPPGARASGSGPNLTPTLGPRIAFPLHVAG